MIDENQIATAADLEDLNCGEPVWFVGYPDGWRDELHNLPLMRTGSIASLPRLSFDGRSEFVIDAQAFPGSSGSPVFARFGDMVKLVGVLTETGKSDSPVRGAPPSLGTLSVEEVIGLGIVIRGTQLLPLLDAVRVDVKKMVADQQGA
jgi:hypothetical protein